MTNLPSILPPISEYALRKIFGYVPAPPHTLIYGVTGSGKGGPGLGSPIQSAALSTPSAFHKVQKIALASTRPLTFGASGSGKGSSRKPDPQYFAKKY